MFKPLELCIGLRYVRAKRRSRFISFISLTSMLGIALGVTALITVLSVMNGFERELRTRILGMASHATITGVDRTLTKWRDQARVAAEHPRVVGVAPYVDGQAMVTRGTGVRGVALRGIDPAEEPQVSEVHEFMEEGTFEDLKPGAYNILIGRGLANLIRAKLGTKITVVAPQAKITPAGVLPRLRRFTVVGIFRVDHGQYDTSLGIVHIRDAARLFRLGDRVSGIRLKMDDLYAAQTVSREVARKFSGLYYVSDWTRHHANFFRALKTEKTVMFVILSLIVAVAAFNIVSTLIMVVTDKQADIAILRTLGMPPASVMAVFVVQGFIIGVFGALLGACGGIALALNVETLVPAIEAFFGVQFLPADIYYITQVPSDLRWPDVYMVSAVAFVLTVIATLYPAWRASRTHPAQALRYE
ncbi:MAG: lipoprotein-releasing ABC transporter permease subunit [Pseudomonadota bacterium]